ncbi:MAG: SH3 domain-containing protein [Anaerolineae bacterium]
MNWVTSSRRPLRQGMSVVGFLLVSLLFGCASGGDEPPLSVPTLVIHAPEQPALAGETQPPTPTLAATAVSDAAPTISPPASPTPPEPVPTPAEPRYQVAFVTVDDELNVRAGPGVENEVVGVLPPEAADVEITGEGQEVSGSTWVPISAAGVEGWVNSRFLAQTVEADTFCTEPDVLTLMGSFLTAVREEDGELLAQLVHLERGLRLHQAWWNPKVRLTHDEVSDLFNSSTRYDFGVEDGSGRPIVGTFSEVMLPLLQEDLLGAAETACNEILHGPTAGIVQLPDGYQSVRYFSFFRPPAEGDSEFDWGTWVVGVELWQGQYYISYLVHYAWEI